MNKKEIRARYSKGMVSINLSKLYPLKDIDFQKKSIIDGKLQTSSYMLKSTLIDDLSQLYMGFLDNYWPYNNKEKFKIRPDKDTLEFIGTLIDDISEYALNKVESNPYMDIEDIEYEIPIYLEICLWRIYILLNELNKYIYNETLFEFADQIMNREDQDIKDFIENFCGINHSWKRSLWVLFDKIGNEDPVVKLQN